MSGTDYLELLPVKWRAINDYGIRIDYRTYDCAELGPLRRQHSGLTGKRGLWEVHYDPYDLTQVFLRAPDGWITAPWTHRAMVTAPFADFTWRHARRLAEQTLSRRGEVTETEIARALDELLTRAEHGPDKTSARVVARTRTAKTDRPALPTDDTTTANAAAVEHASQADSDNEATVVPFGVFDVDAEVERWL